MQKFRKRRIKMTQGGNRGSYTLDNVYINSLYHEERLIKKLTLYGTGNCDSRRKNILIGEKWG
jgi:hypothetical protein